MNTKAHIEARLARMRVVMATSKSAQALTFKMLGGAAVSAVVPVPPAPAVGYQIGLDLAQAGQVADFARYVLITQPGGRLVMHTITQKAGGLIQIGPLLPDVMLSEVGVSHE